MTRTKDLCAVLPDWNHQDCSYYELCPRLPRRNQDDDPVFLVSLSSSKYRRVRVRRPVSKKTEERIDRLLSLRYHHDTKHRVIDAEERVVETVFLKIVPPKIPTDTPHRKIRFLLKYRKVYISIYIYGIRYVHEEDPIRIRGVYPCYQSVRSEVCQRLWTCTVGSRGHYIGSRSRIPHGTTSIRHNDSCDTSNRFFLLLYYTAIRAILIGFHS